jgi:hypothetical protein
VGQRKGTGNGSIHGAQNRKRGKGANGSPQGAL